MVFFPKLYVKCLYNHDCRQKQFEQSAVRKAANAQLDLQSHKVSMQIDVLTLTLQTTFLLVSMNVFLRVFQFVSCDSMMTKLIQTSYNSIALAWSARVLGVLSQFRLACFIVLLIFSSFQIHTWQSYMYYYLLCFQLHVSASMGLIHRSINNNIYHISSMNLLIF